MNKLTINNKDFKGLVSTICREITNEGWRPDYIVGITRGGLTAAVMMSHYLQVPMHTLNVSLREGIELGPESNLWMAEDAFGYGSAEPKNILIVDDINDSGDTLKWIVEDWQSGCLPTDTKWESVWGNNVRFAVVVNNAASKFIYKTYSGMEINKRENDVWVEFPYETWWK